MRGIAGWRPRKLGERSGVDGDQGVGVIEGDQQLPGVDGEPVGVPAKFEEPHQGWRCRVDFGEVARAAEGGIEPAAQFGEFVRGAGEGEGRVAAGGEVVDGQRLFAQVGNDEESGGGHRRLIVVLCGTCERQDGQEHEGEDGHPGGAVEAVEADVRQEGLQGIGHGRAAAPDGERISG